MNDKQMQPVIRLTDQDLASMQLALEPRAMTNAIWFAITAYAGWLRLQGMARHHEPEHPFEPQVQETTVTSDRRFMMMMSVDSIALKIREKVHSFDGTPNSAQTIANDLLDWIHKDALARATLREAFSVFKRLLEMADGLQKSPELAQIYSMATGRALNDMDDIKALGAEFLDNSSMDSNTVQLVITGQATQVMRDNDWPAAQFGLNDVLMMLKGIGEITGLGDNAQLNSALPKGLLNETVLAWFAHLKNLFVLSPLSVASVGVALNLYPGFAYKSESGQTNFFRVQANSDLN